MSDMPAPVDPQNTLAYRGAKYAVIVLTALIILALIGLVAGTIMKLSRGSSRDLAASSGEVFQLPPGAKILASQTQPGRLILHVRSSEGEEFDIIDTNDGKLIGRVKTAPPSQAGW